MRGECRYCNASVPRLYALPVRLRPEQRAAGPACYFCFLRATGIKPSRRELVLADGGGDAPAESSVSFS